MFKPEPMTLLKFVVLERDERAVLDHLGHAGVIQLERTPVGPDTAPLGPRNRSQDLERLKRISSQLENLRRSLGIPTLNTRTEGDHEPRDFPLERAQKELGRLEAQSNELTSRRQCLKDRLAELTTANATLVEYRGLDLPLDQEQESSFLHFVTGSLPTKNFAGLKMGAGAAVIPLAEAAGQQHVIAMTTRRGRAELDGRLKQAGFQPELLPTEAGGTVEIKLQANEAEASRITAELGEVENKLGLLAGELALIYQPIQQTAGKERSLLEAEQNFARTGKSVLATGWVPRSEAGLLAQNVAGLTQGRCVIATTAAEDASEPEVPVLLRHPRWLRPFDLLVKAYGLPKYLELEPTLFVAVSYVLMFGMMFGDAGHGFLLALGGLILWLAGRGVKWRDAGLLLLFCGCSSMIFGACYGSYFGITALAKYALWHDPLAGDPASLMIWAVSIGFILISLGLVLNILNLLRKRDFIGALLDKFGVAGAVLYWGALALATQWSAIRSHGALIPAILFILVVPVAGWILKGPLAGKFGPMGERVAEGSEGFFTNLMESFVNAFEGLISYFANTVSFVRLAAYAMSHAALLLATFTLAADLRQLSPGGGFLSVMMIIFGNAVALVLEGIVASVQALRLEYYEFFGKFFSGGGRPFVPFRFSADQ